MKCRKNYQSQKGPRVQMGGAGLDRAGHEGLPEKIQIPTTEIAGGAGTAPLGRRGSSALPQRARL